MFEEIVRDIGFTTQDAALLARAESLVSPHFGAVVDHFYEVIGANPDMASVFDGPAMVARQKGMLTGWLRLFFAGPYDESYFEQRAKIGRTHVRIGLDQHFMFTMMGVLRADLTRLLQTEAATAEWSREEVRDACAALDKLCDLELAVMLETYREDWNERLRRTERLAALGTFAATIGHELRNPLAVIDTSVHLLSRSTGDDPKVARHVGRISQQVAVCNEIITDLLELARDRPPDKRWESLLPFLEEVLLPLRQERVSIVLDVSQTLTGARFDAGQLRQVMGNLVSNAAQAVGNGEVEVVVRVYPEGETLRIDVEDDGPGIDPEHLPHLFEPLFTTRARGVGLGLALCRSVVEKHGGTITAANGARGARFSIELPEALRPEEGEA